MSAPTVEINAFSPPQVNGGKLRVLVNIGPHSSVFLSGERKMMRELAADLIKATDGVAAVVQAQPEPVKVPVPTAPGRINKKSAHRLTKAMVAKYHAVLARVKAGASWADAAEAEQVITSRCYGWLYYHGLVEAKH